jgi:hypothetical protein
MDDLPFFTDRMVFFSMMQFIPLKTKQSHAVMRKTQSFQLPFLLNKQVLRKLTF